MPSALCVEFAENTRHDGLMACPTTTFMATLSKTIDVDEVFGARIITLPEKLHDANVRVTFSSAPPVTLTTVMLLQLMNMREIFQNVAKADAEGAMTTDRGLVQFATSRSLLLLAIDSLMVEEKAEQAMLCCFLVADDVQLIISNAQNVKIAEHLHMRKDYSFRQVVVTRSNRRDHSLRAFLQRT